MGYGDLIFLMKKQIKNKKAFTLIELVVAISISVLVMISFSVTFSGIMRNYYKGRNINENLENVQYALSLMGKTIRTSTLKEPAGTNQTSQTIIIYDYSQGNSSNPGLCIRYRFTGSSLQKSEAPSADESSCSSGSTFSTPTSMTSGSVTGSFYTSDSSGDDTAKTSERVGKVTVRASVVTGSGSTQTKSTDIQTTVSLRDYGVSNVGVEVNDD